ncbi:MULTISPECIES: hypothetical protein [unclassified Actinomyces]|uniref:hypothetical protein n=1 Tax=unclassified Actinomyces TaxID=2609248 RepID=UPI001373D707|nr:MULTISPECIES: hypothetical protein [unclassified Actinomyces]NDR53397.1 hypothetical protein [Actinomyces sp. 565]QHO91969.1 hypothetical protein CWT12_12500 [Actinomyces sp. 432]
MAQDHAQRWNRTEGVLVVPGTQPDAVAARLEADRVVARLEWYPATPHLLSLTLLADADGRVAVTPPSRGGAIAGIRISELVESLAREFSGDVTIGPASFNALPDGVALPSVSEQTPDASRTVVVSPLSAYMVPLQATLLERPLAVVSLPALDRRVVMYAGEGNELGTFGWDEESLPALVMSVDTRDIAVRAVVTGESEDDAVFSWGMSSKYVWGGVATPGPALRHLVDELLKDSTDVSLVAQTVPGADAQAVAEAFSTPGLDGLVALVDALGMPDWVASVLTGRLAPAEAPGAVVHEPRGLSNAVGRSVGLMLQDPSAPGSVFWQTYIDTVTERPWIMRAGALLEAGIGGVLIGAAVRRRGRTGLTSRGLLGTGVVLLVDAVAEVSLASWTRHRELRRRADEEMALVAEELGA